MLGADVERIRKSLVRERAMRERVLGDSQYATARIMEIDAALDSLHRIEQALREDRPYDFPPTQGELFPK